ncbi:MAG: NfeD family protein [Oscillospiraceae bacterium]|nr:NfeD family protein [Oscillospiraceae bacterium]
MIGMIQISMTVVWLTAVIVLLIVEAMVPGLVSIWFALGALAAMISSMLSAPLWLQVGWFFLVSIVSLALTRPIARKYVNGRAVHTNADMAIGQDCVVTEEIDNVRGTGAVSVGGKIWTARMADPDGRAAKGAVLRAVRIEGVKLIVEEKRENMEVHA